MTFHKGRYGRYQKYENVRTETDGRSFASRFEASVYSMLRLLERAGELVEIRCQESIYLTAARIEYKPDFSFLDVKRDMRIWAEAKGFETPEWKIKLRLWKHYGPGILQIWKGTAGRPRMVEEIVPVDLKKI